LTVGRSVNASLGPRLWALDMIIASERLFMAALVGVWGVQQAMIFRESDARMSLLKNDALEYLKQHSVSFKTQLQVLNSLQETRNSVSLQRHFLEFVDDFPEEVRRKICEEMWGKRLRSLDLLGQIGEWHRSFIPELALLVREDMLATRTIVCHEGDASIAAFMILRGELKVLAHLLKSSIPNFTEGMWVGEKALVNPELRRSATVIAVTFTILMAVPADGFHQLLSRFKLHQRFEELCEDHLWKGLCGRCGAFGSHFSDACPNFRDHRNKVSAGRAAQRTLQRLRSQAAGPGEAWPCPEDEAISSLSGRGNRGGPKALMIFLRMQGLGRLAPTLQKMGVTSLANLQGLDIHDLRARLELTEAEENALSPRAFEDFQNRLRMAGRNMIRKGALHRSHHLLFLSHYKVEAGTEAALMRSELEQLMSEDPSSPSRHFDVPVFLDSEDLTDLTILQERVFHSHNIVLLLTKGVLTRPWVLVEIVTAISWCIPVLLVAVEKAGSKFEFPEEPFYEQFRKGEILSKQDMAVLADCGISPDEVVRALKGALKRIAVPYSPHKAATIRRAELQALLDEVTLRECQ